MMDAVAYVNGRICGQDDAVISVFDHGFLFGEGVYEVIRTYNHRLFLLDRHLRRLHRSADLIALPIPLPDPEFDRVLRSMLDQFFAQPVPGGREVEAYVRIMVTRGSGDVGYDPSACTPSVVMLVKANPEPDPAIWDRGVTITLLSRLRNHPNSVSPAIKSNNLLNNALAMQEAIGRSAFEGLMRNYRGELAECAMSNIFAVKDGTLRTPPLDAGILGGITRELVLDMAPSLGIAVRVDPMFDRDLLEADEAFLSVTTRELIPVVRVDSHTIGTGTPGPITNKLLNAYREYARRVTS